METIFSYKKEIKQPEKRRPARRVWICFFQCKKKPVTIFKTSVTDHYGVILNATSEICKNEPFITKTRPWYKPWYKFSERT